METRVFFVVEGLDKNPVLLETLEQAKTYLGPIYICTVKTAYKEDDGRWNYEEKAGWAEIIKVIEGELQ